MSDLADILRIVAKHISACADELEGQAPEPEPEPADALAAAKAAQRERHKRLGK